MTASYIGIVPGTDGLPIISKAVVRNDTVYLCGVTPDPVGDIRTQTRQVLERIDRLLQTDGTDKSRLLTAQVWLSDMNLFEAHNAFWNEWVDPTHPPVRACVGAALWRPGMLVEIMVTAEKPTVRPTAPRRGSRSLPAGSDGSTLPLRLLRRGAMDSHPFSNLCARPRRRPTRSARAAAVTDVPRAPVLAGAR